ncbi:MAG: VWA domain-containing protein [Planctomycetia bacterium]|nr:VWA domain-containing protein [Planctomycetia bacterium]
MTWARMVGWLLGIDNVEAIEFRRLSFTESWASNRPVWVFFGALAMVAVGVVSYYRFEPAAKGRSRLLLAALRGLALGLLLVILAGPALTVVSTTHPSPLLYLVFDGSDSMAIQDNVSADQQNALAAAVDLQSTPGKSTTDAPRRIDYIKALVRQKNNNVIERLAKNYRLRAFVFDRPEGIRSLALSKSSQTDIEPALLADSLTTDGEVTALGAALDELAVRHKKSQLAGVVLLSDFGWNNGPYPVGAETSPVARLHVPIYTIGVGPEAALDLRVELAAASTTKKGERTTINVTLIQSQLDGQMAHVKVTAVPRKAGDGQNTGANTADKDARDGETRGGTVRIGDRTVRLEQREMVLDFPFEPQEAGQFELIAEVEPLTGEQVLENNKARRDLTATDDFLRLLYVANEPSWEWRFVKEVFHRDKLVGTRGFHTYLRASDPDVRRQNPMFLPSLEMPRNEFFANDILFLGDMPRLALTPTFCEQVKEYVDKFGGGLVVMAGPVHGVGELSETPLADLLPVSVESGERIRAKQPFKMRLTPAAASADAEFMQLGASADENRAAWENLGPLNWYQPATKKHFQATVLAEHPTDTLADGKTPQPLIAVRQYGKGEVVYFAFDELWRLRRRYGEQYYRQFWGQLIHRLGLKHAVGSQKRFDVSTGGQTRFREGDQVTLTVDAYDENFKPLLADRISEHKLQARVIPPNKPGERTEPQPLAIPFARAGLFEAQVPLYGPGEYRVVVTDPVTRNEVETTFKVDRRSAERQSAVREVKLQQRISDESGGKAYDLTTASKLPDEITTAPLVEVTPQTIPLWATPLCFGLLVLLTAGEWIGRKWLRLP